MTPQSAPHEAAEHEITVRRGHFWIPGERVETAHGTVQRAPMFVYWEAPPEVAHPYPLVLIHGGGGQGTDWTGTPVAVVSGGSSTFAEFTPLVVDFLNTVGAAAEHLHLPEHGITGNGHGLIFEANSDHTIKPVIDWVLDHVKSSPRNGQHDH